MRDLVFLDTETLGLHPDAPIWEFAAIRRTDKPCPYHDGPGAPFACSCDGERIRFTIHHDPHPWLDDFPEEFAADYRPRYDPKRAASERSAAWGVHAITKDAHIIGAVPSFDTERLTKLLHRNGIQPAWHYHLIDIENVVVGYLAAKGQLLAPPWKSDDLSTAIGVDPTQFARHTAMGDVRWAMAQWDAVMDHA